MNCLLEFQHSPQVLNSIEFNKSRAEEGFMPWGVKPKFGFKIFGKNEVESIKRPLQEILALFRREQWDA